MSTDLSNEDLMEVVTFCPEWDTCFECGRPRLDHGPISRINHDFTDPPVVDYCSCEHPAIPIDRAECSKCGLIEDPETTARRREVYGA